MTAATEVNNEKSGSEYPTGENTEVEDVLMLELTMDELKTAFRLFDEDGEGFIKVDRFRLILKEIDEDITDEELDEIILEIDADNSNTIDFQEFIKIMS